MPNVVYRGGSQTDDNLTPRPEKDLETRKGRAPGLSAFDRIEMAVEPGSKVQGIDLKRLGDPLRAFPDDPEKEGGVMGHLSIAPVQSDGTIDLDLLGEWAATRKSGRVHRLTSLLRDAIVQPDMRRSR
jgi:hypothetical protein